MPFDPSAVFTSSSESGSGSEEVIVFEGGEGIAFEGRQEGGGGREAHGKKNNNKRKKKKRMQQMQEMGTAMTALSPAESERERLRQLVRSDLNKPAPGEMSGVIDLCDSGDSDEDRPVRENAHAPASGASQLTKEELKMHRQGFANIARAREATVAREMHETRMVKVDKEVGIKAKVAKGKSNDAESHPIDRPRPVVASDDEFNSDYEGVGTDSVDNPVHKLDLHGRIIRKKAMQVSHTHTHPTGPELRRRCERRRRRAAT